MINTFIQLPGQVNLAQLYEPYQPAFHLQTWGHS